MVTLEALEARDPGELEFLDILPASTEDAHRDGRVVRAELPLAEVLQREPTNPEEGPSYGELFDRLIADDGLRAWIEDQPSDIWREANLTALDRRRAASASPLEHRVRTRSRRHRHAGWLEPVA